MIRFEGLPRPIVLIDCAAVLACFPKVFRGWRYCEIQPEAVDPILSLRRDDKGYLVEAAWLDQPLRRPDHIDGLCGFIAELIRAFVDSNPPLLCLHGAAVEFAGKLVVFPNRYRAGKSVLSACLATSGLRLFTDDVLPIGGPQDHGIAPGIAPRLRLPLPDDLSPDMRRRLDERRGPSGKRYCYLDLPDRELAPHGTSAPIGGFVLLERDADAVPELLPVGESELLRQVIWQNFGRIELAPRILERLHGMVAGSRSFRLRYARAEQALDLLHEAFSTWPAETERSESIRPDGPNGTVPTSASKKPGAPAGSYLRSPEITETVVEGERFLADAQGAAIHHLNPVASAVWNLLAEPMTKGQVIDLLHAAFPDVDRDVITRDVTSLIRDLSAKRLLNSVG